MQVTEVLRFNDFEGLDAYGFNAAYTEIATVYLLPKLTEATTTSDDTYTAVVTGRRSFPSVSVGYEWGDDGSQGMQ